MRKINGLRGKEVATKGARKGRPHAGRKKPAMSSFAPIAAAHGETAMRDRFARLRSCKVNRPD
jgi:hypothetical protein